MNIYAAITYFSIVGVLFLICISYYRKMFVEVTIYPIKYIIGECEQIDNMTIIRTIGVTHVYITNNTGELITTKVPIHKQIMRYIGVYYNGYKYLVIYLMDNTTVYFKWDSSIKSWVEVSTVFLEITTYKNKKEFT